jgi:hypothetical protein
MSFTGAPLPTRPTGMSEPRPLTLDLGRRLRRPGRATLPLGRRDHDADGIYEPATGIPREGKPG